MGGGVLTLGRVIGARSSYTPDRSLHQAATGMALGHSVNRVWVWVGEVRFSVAPATTGTWKQPRPGGKVRARTRAIPFYPV